MIDTDPMREAQWRSPATWKCPISTVADLIGNLQTIDQSMEVRGAYFVEGVSDRARARGLSLSRERVSNGRIKSGDDSVPYSLVIWTAPDEAALAAQPPAPSRGREEIAKKLYEHHCKRVGRSAPWTDSEKMEWLGFAEAILAQPAVSQHERGQCKCGVMCQDLGKDAGCRYTNPARVMLRKLVDIVYQHATESATFPATITADLLIDRAFGVGAVAPVADRAAIVEECAKVADDFASYEETVIERSNADPALSETGRKDINYAAGSRQVAAEQIAHDIRALADAKGDER